MGESKIPIYAYVDESGNTGKNIFDPSQPDYYTAALLSKGNFDAYYTDRIRAIAAKVGATSIHASELGLGRLDTIAADLFDLLLRAGPDFFLCRVEKKYLLATKMLDARTPRSPGTTTISDLSRSYWPSSSDTSSPTPLHTTSGSVS